MLELQTRAQESQEQVTMFRTALTIFLMGTLMVGAAFAGTSLPVLLLMGSLLLVALFETSARHEREE